MSTYPWPPLPSPRTEQRPQPRAFRDILAALMADAGSTTAALAEKIGVHASMISKLGGRRHSDEDHRGKAFTVPDRVLDGIIQHLQPCEQDEAELRLAALLLANPRALEVVARYLGTCQTSGFRPPASVSLRLGSQVGMSVDTVGGLVEERVAQVQ